MATDKPRVTVTLDDSTLRRIEEFKFKNRVSTLSKACNELIVMALDQLEEIEPIEKEFDALEEMDRLMELLAGMKENMVRNRKEGN
jgi:hypothetical protein